MADSTVNTDSATRDRFAATEVFREAVGRPGIAAAFDREFGGLPSSTSAHRAA
ncbi:hypothetical protein ACFVFI_04050 [Streptomyces sp. NPDC057705]|uniref:hypothetical protein n=1 Tax=Streptomyces sp. NPDC057705 TaxID=3346222 RepID=UPI003685ACF1